MAHFLINISDGPGPARVKSKAPTNNGRKTGHCDLTRVDSIHDPDPYLRAILYGFPGRTLRARARQRVGMPPASLRAFRNSTANPFRKMIDEERDFAVAQFLIDPACADREVTC